MTTQRSGGSDPIEDAVRWHRLFVEGDVSTLESGEFTEWAAWSGQPENIQTFRAVHHVWESCGAPALKTSLPTDADIAADEYDGSVSMSEWLSRRSHNEGHLSLCPRGLNRRTFLRHRGVFSLVACLITMGVVLALYHDIIWGKLFDESRTYATTSSQRKLVTLSDGSALTLAPNTKVTTHYGANRREVALERGEAWFKVARNGASPFTVWAGAGEIVALGTQFDVRREKGTSLTDRVTVAVGYGSVEVRLPSKESISPSVGQAGNAKPAGWTPARLKQGQEVTYDSTGLRGAVQQADLEAVAGWKQVKSEYDHTPLKTVIEEVNQYSDKPVVLSDPDGALGSIPFSGTVFEFQLSGWLQALQATYPVEVIELPDRFIIRPRND
jgi:transmembrane sensor